MTLMASFPFGKLFGWITTFGINHPLCFKIIIGGCLVFILSLLFFLLNYVLSVLTSEETSKHTLYILTVVFNVYSYIRLGGREAQKSLLLHIFLLIYIFEGNNCSLLFFLFLISQQTREFKTKTTFIQTNS